MLEASYGKEPFDQRLTMLRLIRQWKKLLIAVLAGALAVGGLYCARYLLFAGEKTYQAVSIYRMDYSVDDTIVSQVMINDYTWNTYVHTEEFLNNVRERLSGTGWEGMSCEELGECVRGDIASDWRVPSTRVLTENAGKTESIAKAVEEVLTEVFPDTVSEVKSIRVLDPAHAEEVVPDLRVGRAFGLGAVLALFAAVVILLMKETGDDNIWLPKTIDQRYGIRTAGTLSSGDLSENLGYFFSGIKKAVVCPVQEDCDPAEVVRILQENCGESVETRWGVVQSPLAHPEAAVLLRQAEGILLAVKAGAHAGKQTEYVVDFLEKQGCKITAAILVGADEGLIRCYYGFSRREG